MIVISMRKETAMKQTNQKQVIHESKLKEVTGGNTDYSKCPICEEIAFKSSKRIGGGQCISCGYNPAFQKCPQCGKWKLHVMPGGFGGCTSCGYKVNP